ncbi:MAG TPA: hypothetical protein VM783_07800 [Candidatus Acidoferrum sp.]|nr:hypothetical protein [Candidatus Acidoferrum sp.]
MLTKRVLFVPGEPPQILEGAPPRAIDCPDGTYMYNPKSDVNWQWSQASDNNFKFQSRDLADRIWLTVADREIPGEYLASILLPT